MAWTNNFTIGRNAQASTISYDPDKSQSSFAELKNKTNQDLQIVVDYYQNRAGLRWFFSGLIRWAAIFAASSSALAINPIVQKMLSIEAQDLLAIVSILIVAAGFFLSIDWAFSVTKKYTDWMLIAFELAIEKDDFILAFTSLFSDHNKENLTEEKFHAAKILCLETVKEFDQKCLEETQDWAKNLTAILKTLNSRHSNLSVEHQKASQRILNELNPNTQNFGLTVKIENTSDRKDSTLVLTMFNDVDKEPIETKNLVSGETISMIIAQGRYIIDLKRQDLQIASKVIYLNKDISTTI